MKTVEEHLDVIVLHMKTGNSLEIVLDLAVMGLSKMAEQTKNNSSQVASLQVASGHLSQVLKQAIQTQSVQETREYYAQVARLIEKYHTP